MTNMYGFPYWLVLRADLQRALYHGATKAGAQVHFARAVSAVLDDEQAQPRLTLGDGEEFSADIIIGADRARSRCRKSMFPDSVLDPIPTDSVIVAAEGVHRNPRTRRLLESASILGMSRIQTSQPRMVEDIEAMRSEFGDFDPVVRELLNMVDSAQRWQLQNCQCWISGQALPDGVFR
ncbi:hypothetical protein KJ359_013260 [Pestalotiopsis sp. 9143b]|nr:hypothetical protein KJ359_013260 [Pestalotiopsis sp. 9143b]